MMLISDSVQWGQTSPQSKTFLRGVNNVSSFSPCLGSLWKTLMYNSHVRTRLYIRPWHQHLRKLKNIFLFSLDLVSHCCKLWHWFVMQSSRLALLNNADDTRVFVSRKSDNTWGFVCCAWWIPEDAGGPSGVSRAAAVVYVRMRSVTPYWQKETGSVWLQPPPRLQPTAVYPKSGSRLHLLLLWPCLPVEANCHLERAHICARLSSSHWLMF